MSRLLVKQRVFSWTDTYDIYDRNGEPKYYVKAEAFTIGHRIHVYFHNTDREVGMIKERVFAFLAKADITVGGIELGSISRHLTLFTPKYSIDYNGWTVEGDVFGWDYTICNCKGENIATISKELMRLSDTYSLDIYDDSDELTALLTVIAIDMMNCGK